MCTADAIYEGYRQLSSAAYDKLEIIVVVVIWERSCLQS